MRTFLRNRIKQYVQVQRLIRRINSGKKDCFGGTTLHIPKTSMELAEMNVVDYGDQATSVNRQDTSSRYSMVKSTGNMKRRKTDDKIVNAIFGKLGKFFFGSPYIILTCKDLRIIGSKAAQFRNGRNITLQTVITGSRRCLGSTGSRHMYFKDTSHLDKRNERLRP